MSDALEENLVVATSEKNTKLTKVKQKEMIKATHTSLSGNIKKAKNQKKKKKN